MRNLSFGEAVLLVAVALSLLSPDRPPLRALRWLAPWRVGASLARHARAYRTVIWLARACLVVTLLAVVFGVDGPLP